MPETLQYREGVARTPCNALHILCGVNYLECTFHGAGGGERNTDTLIFPSKYLIFIRAMCEKGENHTFLYWLIETL